MTSLQTSMIESRAAAFACLLLLLPGISHSMTTFESPPQAVPLIELFTSEGCNSCPPADAWLSSADAAQARAD